MIVFPAVDIKNGQCVRLKQGKENEVTVFDADPVRMAVHWVEQGASWLHIVDLDGAFSGRPSNRDLVEKICREVDVPVQLGGGVRDQKTASAYIDAGVARLIVGTMALEEENRFAGLCVRFPGKIGVSLDARNGVLKTKGWVGDSGLRVEEVLPSLEQAGSAFFVYTDISRDGMQSGVNLPALEKMLQIARKPVIAAGGVSTMEDLKILGPLVKQGLEGVISGKAIYEKTLDFNSAARWARSQG